MTSLSGSDGQQAGLWGGRMWSVHSDGVQLQPGGGGGEAPGSQCLSGSTVQCGWHGSHHCGGNRQHPHCPAPCAGEGSEVLLR